MRWYTVEIEPLIVNFIAAINGANPADYPAVEFTGVTLSFAYISNIVVSGLSLQQISEGQSHEQAGYVSHMSDIIHRTQR
jgi:hypothetical protein